MRKWEGRTNVRHRTGFSSTLDLICNIRVKAATDPLRTQNRLRRMGWDGMEKDGHGGGCAKRCGLNNTQSFIWFGSKVFLCVES
jgi:hypothetical protein